MSSAAPARDGRFSFSDEQEEFRRVVRRFLQDVSPPGEVRRLSETEAGFEPAVWRRLCEELALPGLHLPEELGGQGFGAVELGIALEETGRALLCAPFFSSAVLAGTAILEAASEPQKKELLPALATGATRATLALSEPACAWDPVGVALTATPAAGGYRLDGAKTLVPDGHTAEVIVVVARLPGTSGSDGLTLLTVPGASAGLTRRALATLDGSRKLARLDFSGVAAEPLGEPGRAGGAVARTLELACVALASEMMGGAQKVFEDTLAYVKTRVQFGRAIGSFQAIKHRCAELVLQLELAKSAAYYAAAAAAANDPQLPELASLAKATCSDAYRDAVLAAIQLHGGVGFTWENDTHLYFRRARSSEAFLGDPAFHRERFLRCAGLRETKP